MRECTEELRRTHRETGVAGRGLRELSAGTPLAATTIKTVLGQPRSLTSLGGWGVFRRFCWRQLCDRGGAQFLQHFRCAALFEPSQWVSGDPVGGRTSASPRGAWPPARREARTPRSSLPRNCRGFVLAPLNVGACGKLPACYMPRGQGLPTHGVCWKHVPTYPWV